MMLNNLIKTWKLYFILNKKNPQKLQKYLQNNAFSFWGVAQKIFPDLTFNLPVTKKYLQKTWNNNNKCIFKNCFVNLKYDNYNYIFTDFSVINKNLEKYTIRILNPLLFDNLDAELGFLYFIKNKPYFKSLSFLIQNEISLIEKFQDLRFIAADIENANDGRAVDWINTTKNILVFSQTEIILENRTRYSLNPSLHEVSIPFLSQNKILNIIKTDSPGKRFEQKKTKL